MPFLTQNNAPRLSLLAAIYTLTVLGAVAEIAYSSLRGGSAPIVAMTDSFGLVPYTVTAEGSADATYARR